MRTLSVLAFLLIASLAHAQDHAFFAALQPGTPVADKPGCTWQWAQNTVGPWGGWYHACTEQRAPDPQAPIEPACLSVDIYAQPEHAVACAARYLPPRPTNLRDYRVGTRYYLGYPSVEMVVVALSRGLDGIEIVTYQHTRMTGSATVGDVAACRNDNGTSSSSCASWIAVNH